MKIVVLTGSGVSAESGLTTFRGQNGLWDNYPVEDVASIEGWYRNPRLVLDFYNKGRKKVQSVEPNKAHKLIAELEKYHDVCVVTQNVDNLHERAGSSNIIHLHGEITKVRPQNTYTADDGYSEKYVKDIGYGEIFWGDKENGSQLRPHIVWFGEAVPNIEKAIEKVSEADILLIVGTSLQVYPAAGLYHYASDDCRIYVIDPEDVPIRKDSRIVHIKDVATAGMQQIFDEFSK
ncbi:MAG: NAD-dependent deacylase [Bacteroidales bacterium]|nr:NAD-dependent deacylase [Bacteroidales bacterium]